MQVGGLLILALDGLTCITYFLTPVRRARLVRCILKLTVVDAPLKMLTSSNATLAMDGWMDGWDLLRLQVWDGQKSNDEAYGLTSKLHGKIKHMAE